MKTALIDADSLLYVVGFSMEDSILWNEDEEPSYYSNIEQQLNSIDAKIKAIMLATNCDDYELHLTGKGNFRDTNPLGYKQNRVGLRKPTDFNKIYSMVVKRFNVFVAVGWEADDVVVQKKMADPDKYILCAIDKDVVYQTVGYHYNYGQDTFVKVSEKLATWFAYFQVIAGDPTDGYKGKTGVGATGAVKVLGIPEVSKVFVELLKKHKVAVNTIEKLLDLPTFKDERELWLKTLVCYRSDNGKKVVKMSRSDAIWTMRLANMRQYDGEEIINWLPPRKPQRVTP